MNRESNHPESSDHNHHSEAFSRKTPTFGKQDYQPVTVNVPSRPTRGLWAAIVVLAAALVGLGAYGYLTVNKHNIHLAELPGMQESLNLAGERLDAAEATLGSWSANWEQLEARLKNLQGRISNTRAQARKDAQELVAQLQTRMREETQAQLQERDAAIDARLGAMESAQDAQAAGLAQLRQDVSQVRRDAGQDLGSLQAQVVEQEGNLNALEQSLARRRVDFELAKGNTQEVTPGVAVHIADTDHRFQRVKGWLWLMPDRRTIFVRDLGAQESFVFHHRGHDQFGELVITRVTPDGAIGYVRVPESQVYVGASD